MDLPGAMPEEVTDQIVDLIGCGIDEAIPASGKTGLGVDKILQAIVNESLLLKEMKPLLYRQ